MADALAPPAALALAPEEVGLLAPLYPLPRLELVSGHGCRVRDANGREYLDFVSGIAVNAFGHAPPGLAEALAAQARELVQVSNLFANRPGIELARQLTQATGYARVFFCNSGTEGIEAALKFTRARAVKLGMPGRAVVAFEGGFHGRTAWALSATANPHYREPFEPLVPHVRFAPFNDLRALDAVLDREVAAVIVEPVQGESGALPATRDFLLALRARTSALGAALIFDEVQCGMGRCGRLLAAEHFGVPADVTVLSKALGGGLPLAAVLMNDDTAGALAPGMHGCTFGGGPLAATAGLWVLAQLQCPGVLEGVRRTGRELGTRLDALVERHASLKESRGLGLLRAIELAADAPFDPLTLVAAAREHGLLLIRGGERAVRLLPPLDVSHDDLDAAIAILDRTLTHLESREGATT